MDIIRKNDRFTQLLRTLESGWEIDEPVLLGALWQTEAESSGSYHFVLKNRQEDRTTMMSLRPSAELLLFLAENNIQISPVRR